MKKEEDIYKIFNEMDELINSVNSTPKKEKKDNIPEMPKVFVEENNTLENKKQTKLVPLEIEENKVEIEENNKKEEIVNLKKQKKKTKKNKKWIITFSVLDIIAIICLFLMYGPISYFRNLWVTSAMTTMTHKYLAYIFFSEEQINEIMSNNTIIEVEGSTNKEEIEIISPQEPVEEIIEYSSPEEEQILKKDPGNDLYKVIEIEGNGYKGHMLVVYDPSKIDLVQSPNKAYGLTIEQFVNKNNAVAGINAGGFSYNASTGYSPLGVLIDNGIIYGTGVTSWGGGVIGFTNDNILVLAKISAEEAIQMGIRDAVSFGPFLIVNGVPSEFRGNGGYGIAPRTAIGQRKDGIVLMLVIDGRRAGHSLGVDMVELTNIMLRYGAYNASNLDGGGSSTIVVDGKTLSVAGGSGYSGDRYLPNSWIVRR